MALGGDLIQCAPISGSCDNPFTSANGLVSLDVMRTQVLSQINAERGRIGLKDLIPNRCLTSVAQAAAVDYTATGVTQGKFDSDCKSLVPNCACGWQAESQATESGNNNWTELVASSVKSMITQSSAPSNILSDRYSQAGVGVVVGQSSIWVSVDLAP